MNLPKKKKIKTMNSKMTTNSQLSTTESKNNKNKLSKQLEQEQNQRNGEITWRVMSRGVGGERGGKDTENK